MNKFIDLNINDEIIKALDKQWIKNPTKIQGSAIPKILQGLDVIGESETGSGKTLAYLIPLIQAVDYEKRENQFIILTPTHELALQVNKVIETIQENSALNLSSAVIIGNVNIKRQVEKLKEKPQFVIGSPGRILELIKLKKISAHTVKTIVIDECDRLLDENNYDTIKSVVKTTLKQRQLLMFSATVTEEVIEKGKELMREPVIIKEKTESTVNENIQHFYMVCDRRDKVLLLRKLMAGLKPKKAIAFINKTDEIEILSSKLKFHGLKADGIHGSFVKNERKKVMDDFKTGKINLLVASDIAARGLDIEGITHVFNIDIPEDPRDYLHRSGRTGRVNKKGVAISLVTEREIQTIKGIENKFSININYAELYYGRLMQGEYQPNSKPIVKPNNDKDKDREHGFKENYKSDKKNYKKSENKKVENSAEHKYIKNKTDRNSDLSSNDSKSHGSGKSNFKSTSSNKSSTSKSSNNAFNKDEGKFYSGFKKGNGPRKSTHKK